MLAPEFPPELQWLNTDHKLALAELRGRFVLLDFWTYGCINCIRIMPELKRLEEKYPEMMVVGVHSAKFAAERDEGNIEKAVLRYDIRHPVVVDIDFAVWNSYGVNAWPSFVLIAPDGEVLGKTSGEGIFDVMDAIMPRLIEDYDRRGVLKRERMSFALLRDSPAAPGGFLAFPGKVIADPDARRIFVSDSSHHRILVLGPEGEILDVIGSGREGSKDGPFHEASFFWPQGMALDKDSLYIADTDNNLIRVARLKEKKVETIETVASTGAEAMETMRSPWDIAVLGDWIYIAMAGAHQIWRMNRKTMNLETYAGSGAEGIDDGMRLEATLAQPSGLTTDGTAIYFADSEASAVRMIKDDRVETLIGRGLFDFGDRDGSFDEARLQHPLGVLYHEGSLYIADTYNHKIKRADLRSERITTVAGDGKPGLKDGPALEAMFREPGGLAYMDGRIYVADTNNHMVRVLDMARERVTTVDVGKMGVPGGCEICGKGGAATGIFTRRDKAGGSDPLQG